MTTEAERHVRVALPGQDYRVRVGRGAVARHLPRIVRRLRPSRLHVVIDSSVERHHGAAMREVLAPLGVPFELTSVPSGERSKSSKELERLWRAMIGAGCDRASCVLACGGGVVGDLAGFAAATVLRGIRFVQIPTTLLAMVDASVGGKTGINLVEGKNLVGAFHQPHAVLADLDLLATLPIREYRAGFAEVIKTAAIRDARLFARLETEREALLARDAGVLGAVVARCVRIKADVVEADEREEGLRRVLNFGHTLAHGIESVQRYGGLLHGEAVAVGMAFAARLGERVGATPAGTARRLEAVLSSYGLPTAVADLRPETLEKAMQKDKKRGRGGVLWVLLRRVGAADAGRLIEDEAVREELEQFLAPAMSTRRSTAQGRNR